MEEKPVGLIIAPMVKSLYSESPNMTLMVEVKVTDERIFPEWSAGKTYSPSDWLIV